MNHAWVRIQLSPLVKSSLQGIELHKLSLRRTRTLKFPDQDGESFIVRKSGNVTEVISF
jgi:hypothetical protein